MRLPKCPICALDLKDNDGFENTEWGKVLVEEQVEFFMHDPRSLHYDIKVKAHKVCFDKAKAVYPNLGEPTEADWGSPKYPVIENDVVSLKTLTQFKNSKIL